MCFNISIVLRIYRLKFWEAWWLKYLFFIVSFGWSGAIYIVGVSLDYVYYFPGFPGYQLLPNIFIQNFFLILMLKISCQVFATVSSGGSFHWYDWILVFGTLLFIIIVVFICTLLAGYKIIVVCCFIFFLFLKKI